MLTPTERRGFFRLLQKLSREELLSLKDTVTKRQIAVQSRNEATRAIVEYSESAVELLRRKKLRREFLFQYLAECGVAISVNAEKYQLIRRVLQYWGSPVPSDRELQEIESGTSSAAAASWIEPYHRIPTATQIQPDHRIPAATQRQPDHRIPTATQIQPDHRIPTATQRQADHRIPTATQRQPDHRIPTATQIQPDHRIPTATQIQPHHRIPTATQRQPHHGIPAAAAAAAPLPVASATAAVPEPTVNGQPTASKHQTLGETFVRWFYDLINSENPMRGGRGDFGPHHFWENCTLKLVSKTPDLSEDYYEGNVLVARRLQALVREELLLFNPNISADGVKVQSDPHGLLFVMVCGTIHQHNKCLGIFQQMFGLIRSPLNETTWKVKTTLLQLLSSQVTTIPKLTDSSTHELLSEADSMAVMRRA